MAKAFVDARGFTLQFRVHSSGRRVLVTVEKEHLTIVESASENVIIVEKLRGVYKVK